MLDVLAFGSHNDCDHQWEIIDRVDGQDQNRTIACLLTSLGGIQVNKVDFTSFDAHRYASPSISVGANSASMAASSAWIWGSAAITVRSSVQSGWGVRVWRICWARYSMSQVCSLRLSWESLAWISRAVGERFMVGLGLGGIIADLWSEVLGEGAIALNATVRDSNRESLHISGGLFCVVVSNLI